ncbi:coiled-coil domain-containing protein 87 isoform X2 [Lingula anatina]|uniref:Coiled-coil domain-containing protein 87 isoform X2 n=1 Tax=Lingula anatina TaxID=7574 RepID=A0A1S3HWH4_LINAN|nr:coiled-coil domain-containing protein 87 isoform X2 [Lingula anatina]|eukprot:XP_013389901.1 coiled-coil domain-containing protein 87 isoform X2 [Lingula anatina]
MANLKTPRSAGMKFQFTKQKKPFASEKREDDTYPMTNFPVTQEEIKDRYEGVMGPLSIFAPYPHEDEPPPETIQMERPVTPIDEEIKAPPSDFNVLRKYIRRRVAAKPEVQHLTIEEQQSLAGVLVGEVNGIWRDIRRQVDDPFLTPEQNKELQRRITVHIVTVCEKLFKHFLEKAQILNKRGVFSGPANMSRLKAQLALDADKYLNILTIRRYIVGDLRRQAEDIEDESEEYIYPSKKESMVEEAVPEISFKGLLPPGMIESSRPKSKIQKHRFTTVGEDLEEIQSRMPILDTSKLFSILADIPERSMATPVSDDMTRSAKKTTAVQKENPDAASIQKVLLKRSHSLQRLPGMGETLLEELGINLDETRSTVTDKAEAALEMRSISGKSIISEKKETTRPCTRQFLRNDLEKLVQRQTAQEPEDADALPPLLQALLRPAKHDGKKAILDRQLKQLEEKQQIEKEKDNVPLQEPTHPQPATVSSKLPNKMVVRTSDVRVSERVCMTSITLQKHNPVYNDLTDEIDQATVKNLDKNLFLGEEIKEVYREIMKTVPSTHLDVEQDELVVPSADSVNLSSVLASSTLSKKKNERIINSELRSRQEPPWGELDVREWAKTPTTPPTDTKGNTYFDPTVPSKANLAGPPRPGAHLFEGLGMDLGGLGDDSYRAPVQDMPAAVMERMSRSYASWLQWWKSTINTDDYMKYLSTQESDYMGVICHFYNSDDEGDEDETARLKSKEAKEAAKRAREEKIKEMRVQKTEFQPGMWNVNTIMLGGLGRDPELEEEEKEKEKPAEETVEKPKKSISLISKKSKEVSQDSLDQPPRDKSRLSDRGASRLATQSRGGETVKSSVTGMKTPASGVPPSTVGTPQDRLERVWSALKMPDNKKLDMAIKYSSEEYIGLLEESIEAWEKSTDLILLREGFIAKLEKFERLASDPNRFFEKGYRGSSVARLGEAKQRSYLYKKIEELDSLVKKAVLNVRDKYQDVITYAGRPYLEKLKWDRIEMLYWLQEERRQQALEQEQMYRDAVGLRMTQLEPILPQQT